MLVLFAVFYDMSCGRISSTWCDHCRTFFY